MRDLDDIRLEINEIDEKMLELFKRRMDCSKAVAEYKTANNLPVLNEKREKEILDKVEENGGEYGKTARVFFSDIMDLSKTLQHNVMENNGDLNELIKSSSDNIPKDGVKVAYQGLKGANGYEAALKLFPKGKVVSYKSFADVFSAVDNEEVNFGVLPVENSTAGSVSAVYDLILKHRFFIVGAYDMPIDYCLAALKQSELCDIEEVWTHPQSIAQCENYIDKHNLKAVSRANTAVAARDTSLEKRLNVAAICSYRAAAEYGLKVIDNHIQDNDNNMTRFIIISKKLYIPEDADKISLCFNLPHVSGSLYSVLRRFNTLGFNLTKIESRPIAGSTFEYMFYLDFSGNVHSEDAVKFLCTLSREMPNFSFLGNYSEV